MTIKDILEVSAVGLTVIVRMFTAPNKFTEHELTFDNVEQFRSCSPDCIAIEDGKLVIVTAGDEFNIE